MRTAIRRNDASFVTHFNQQCDIAHTLRNLHIVVVGRWSDRRPGALKDQTTFGKRPVLGSIEFMPSNRGLAFLLPFARCGHHRRNLSVLWIDDQRGPPAFHNFCSAIPPEIVVCARHIGFGGTVTAILVIAFDNFFFICGRFLLRKELFTCKIGRPLHRRDRGETPSSLQVRLSVRRPQWYLCRGGIWQQKEQTTR